MRGGLWAAVLCAVVFGCGGSDGDESMTSEDAGLGDCTVYDGKDEYLACVCEEVKPCVGISREECPQVIRSSLKYAQHDAGLECTQAMGDLFECEFGLSCQQFNQLNAYWSQCWDTDPSGQRQPFCRRETRNMIETCASVSAPCSP